ncbi:MAG: hypothetical protein HRU11_10860 [Parvularculaceae bacterium]|nr:hypothetical protein [Parvularculaceae bacterium]
MAKHSIIEYTGDGSTIQYPINFTGGYTLEAHVFCQVNDEVDGNNAPIYRTLTFVSAGIVDIGGTVPGAGERIVFTRVTPISAPVVDFEDGVTFTEEEIDAGFEQVIFGIQEAQDNLQDATATQDALAGAEAAQAAAELARDAAQTSETNAGTSETNAGNSETAASNSATAALASENAASASETNAATSETNAGNSETAAALSETNAGNSETAAAASEGAAATSAGNAATSEANAAASYDLFDDRFLGAKAADPTLDNDSDAIQVGALYFNTSTNNMRVYDGTDWNNITTTVSRNLYEYTATAGQTTFTGTDREGNSLTTSGTFLNVHLNGARLTHVDDYTVTATEVILSAGVNAGDEVLIEALTTFNVVNAVLTTAQTLTDADKVQARANIGADFMGGYRNKIINGNMDIWQRGTVSTGSGYNADDRWQNNNAGHTASIQQQPFALGQTEVPGNPRFYSRTHITAVGSVANDHVSKYQPIEDVRTLAGKQATLTFYAKSDATRDMVVEFAQAFGSGGGESPTEIGIEVNRLTLTTSWQRFDVVVDIPSIAGKGIGVTDNSLLGMILWLSSDTPSMGTRNDNIGYQTGIFDIARVSLVEGDASKEADPYEDRPLWIEEKLCYRYYYESPNIHWLTATGSQGTWQEAHLAHPEVLREVPTVAYTGTHDTSGAPVAISGSHRHMISFRLNSGAEFLPHDHVIQYTVSAEL